MGVYMRKSLNYIWAIVHCQYLPMEVIAEKVVELPAGTIFGGWGYFESLTVQNGLQLRIFFSTGYNFVQYYFYLIFPTQLGS